MTRKTASQLDDTLPPTSIELIDTPEPRSVLVRSGVWELSAAHAHDEVLGESWIVRLKWRSRGGDLRFHSGHVLHYRDLVLAGSVDELVDRALRALEFEVAWRLSC